MGSYLNPAREMDEKKNRIGLREESIPSSRQEIEENILKELCEMEKHNHSGCVQELCRRIGLSRHEMSYYLKQMVRHGYIYPEEKRDVVRLTEYGRITGEMCLHRHKTFSQLLQFTGVDAETADEDACRIEHVVSSQTVQRVSHFVHYGESFIRTLTKTDLRFRYQPGVYEFMMGIYYMEKTCPRRLAREFSFFSETITLRAELDRSWFELCRAANKSGRECLWYMNPEKEWVKAQEEDGRIRIPSAAFEYTIRQNDPLIEGVAVIVFAEEGRRPSEWEGRELDVHIW